MGTTMKISIYLVLFSIFLQACSTEVSEQIEGIIWTDNYSKLGGVQAYTRFADGNVLSCVTNENQWNTVTRYELNGSSLAILTEAMDKGKKLFNISVKGSGDSRILILTRNTGQKKIEMKFPVSTSKDCPIS